MNQRTKFVAIAVAAITVLASTLWVWNWKQAATAQGLAADKPATTTFPDRSALNNPSTAPTATTVSGAAQAVSTGKVKLGDEFYEANTPELVDWLNRRGFPSQQVLQSGARAFYPNLGTVNGYPPESVVYAEQLARSSPGRRDEAIAHLTGAAVAGSTYALEALGRTYEDGPNRNIVEAEAYFRVAEHMGDWSIGLTPRKWTLSHEQALVSSILAQQIRLRIDRTRKQAGLPPLTPDMKPGLDEFANAMMAEYESKSR